MNNFSLDSKFKSGICFLCSKECNNGAYCHYECAIAYEDTKKKLMREHENN